MTRMSLLEGRGRSEVLVRGAKCLVREWPPLWLMCFTCTGLQITGAPYFTVSKESISVAYPSQRNAMPRGLRHEPVFFTVTRPRL